MKLRKFLERSIKLVSENELLAARISEDVLDKYDKEITNKNSIYKMHQQDFDNPKGRLEFMFAFKNLEEVDTETAERIFDITYLISLYSYKKKYDVTIFDEEIEEVEARIAETDVPEVTMIAEDEDLVMARGGWSN